ncbi:hypothetical protein MFIFM68171_06803 [Madurella fahalii]|uniref:RNA polymerase II subunit B1 CTD phosphatase RPAP2 homolog n=1 Tax=Madurella fahalii TaxID=1157608 RepID=A0ABQ0GFQ0_9PEZI
MSAESATGSVSAPKPKQPKGILKKTTTSPPPPSQPQPQPGPSPSPSTLSQQQQQHLRLLQHLAKTQLKPPVPIETFERLCQLPSDPTNPASSPSASDVRTFLTALREFQPREYLDLIEERTILGKCGYTLCPLPHRNLRNKFKISTRLGAIAKTEDLNKWCSDECARRGLYLKVQLDNPSYVRGQDGKMEVLFELLDTSSSGRSGSRELMGGDGEDQKQLARAMAQLEIDKSKKQKQANASLAAERGEGGFLGQQGKVEVTIQEKTTDEPALPPSAEDGAHQTVEGYKTTFGTGKKPGESADVGSDSDDDDDFPTIRL